MSQALYHQLSRLALAKAIKTPDDNDPYSEPWSKSVIFTQPFAVELQKKAQAFDINQRTKSQRKPRKQYTCLSSDSEDNTDDSDAEIVPTKYRPRNTHHRQHQPHRENWKMAKGGHSRGSSSQTLSSSTDSSSVEEHHHNKKKHIKHIHPTKSNNNIAYEDQDPYYRKNRPMMDPVYYQNQQQQHHMHALQQRAALERRHNNNSNNNNSKTKTRVTNTDMRRRAEMMRNASDNRQPATPMPRSKYSTGPGWSM